MNAALSVDTAATNNHFVNSFEHIVQQRQNNLILSLVLQKNSFVASSFNWH